MSEWEVQHLELQGRFVDALALQQSAAATGNERLRLRANADLDRHRETLVAHIGLYGDPGSN